jgi:hypothetical protein
MIKFILIAVGILIGLKVERWRGVFVASAIAAGCAAVLFLGGLLLQGEDREYGFAPAPVAGAAIFLLVLAVAALTFAVKKANPRWFGGKASDPVPPDQSL